MKLKNRELFPLIVARNAMLTLIMLSGSGLYAISFHRLKVPLITVVILVVLSATAVHIIVSLVYSMASTTPTKGHGFEVRMESTPGRLNFYSPDKLIVKAGTTVTFKNIDIVPHTATIVKSNFFDTGLVASGQEKQITLFTPGTFDYSCTIHPTMHATIEVEKS